MYHYGYFVHAKIITMRKFKHNEVWSFEDEHVIDGMIYCHEIDKWVTVEEYTNVYYGTL